MTATGVTVPGTTVAAGARAKSHFLAVRFWETFDQTSWNPAAADPVSQRFHTPWLKLLPVDGFADDGRWVPLARVTLDANGNVTGLSHDGRRATALPVEVMRLRRPATAGTAALERPAGEIRAVPTGLEISVPQVADKVVMAAAPPPC